MEKRELRRVCAFLLLVSVLAGSASLCSCVADALGGDGTGTDELPEAFVAGYASRELEYADPSSHVYYVAG